MKNIRTVSSLHSIMCYGFLIVLFITNRAYAGEHAGEAYLLYRQRMLPPLIEKYQKKQRKLQEQIPQQKELSVADVHTPLLEEERKQRLYDDNEGDELDRKHIVAQREQIEQERKEARSEVGQCARASTKANSYHDYYRSIITQALYAHNMPEVLGALVTDYAGPRWHLIDRYTPHEGIVANVGWWDEDSIASFCPQEKYVKVWHKTTKIVQDTDFIQPTIFEHPLPEQIQALLDDGDIEESGGVDFDRSQDKAFLAKICEHCSKLHVWKSDVHFSRAVSLGTCRRISNKGDKQFLSVRFSPCSNYVVGGTVDGIVHIIDVKTGKAIYSLAHEASVTALSADTPGTLLVGLANGSVCIWQGEPLQNIHEFLASEQPQKPLVPGPQALTMTDEPEQPADELQQESGPSTRFGSNALCALDCVDCYKYAKECGVTGFKCCQIGVKCCRTGISCLTSCPRCILYFCCYYPVKKCFSRCYCKQNGRYARCLRDWQAHG